MGVNGNQKPIHFFRLNFTLCCCRGSDCDCYPGNYHVRFKVCLYVQFVHISCVIGLPFEIIFVAEFTKNTRQTMLEGGEMGRSGDW